MSGADEQRRLNEREREHTKRVKTNHSDPAEMEDENTDENLCDQIEREFDELEGTTPIEISDDSEGEDEHLVDQPENDKLETDDHGFNSYSTTFANYGVAKEICQLLLESDVLGGKFAFTEKYHVAPNPGIWVRDYGLLHLPLSETEVEAVALKATSVSLPRDQVIEIPAESMELQNPHWEDWMTELRSRVLKELGLSSPEEESEEESNDESEDVPKDITEDTPGKLETFLSGLRIYSPAGLVEPDSWTLQNDKENAESIIGALEITLPSEFEGGKVILSYEDKEEKVETGDRIKFDTEATAWFSDVSYRSAPISKGYKVTLVYQLIFKSTRTHKPAAAQLYVTDDVVAAVEKLVTPQKPVAFVLPKDFNAADLTSKRMEEALFDHNKGIVHHLAQAVAKTDNFAIYLGNIVTYSKSTLPIVVNYSSITKKDMSEFAYIDSSLLDDREYVDLELLQGRKSKFNVGNMTHLAGFYKSFEHESNREWEGPILTFGPRLSASKFDEKEFEYDIVECRGLFNSQRHWVPGFKRWFRAACVFLYPISALESLKEVAEDTDVSWERLEYTIAATKPRSDDVVYTKTALGIILKVCITAKSYTAYEIEQAGRLLAKLSEDLGSAAMDIVINDFKSLIESKVPNEEVVYSRSLPRHEILEKLFRMMQHFPHGTSRLLLLPTFQSLLGSRFFLAEDNMDILLEIGKVLDWDTCQFEPFLEKSFTINPSENFRQELDKKMRIHFSSYCETIAWVSLSNKCHEYVVEGIGHRLRQFVAKGSVEPFRPAFRNWRHPEPEIDPFKNYQVIGYSSADATLVKSEYCEKLTRELIGYLKCLDSLEHPKCDKLIVRFLEFISLFTSYTWPTEMIFQFISELMQLPSASKVRAQTTAVQNLFQTFQSAVLKLYPCQKPTVSEEAPYALPPLQQVCQRQSCRLCVPLDAFLQSPVQRLTQVESVYGEKVHFQNVANFVNRSLDYKDDYGNLINVSNRSSDAGFKGQNLILIFQKSDKMVQRVIRQRKKFEEAVIMRKKMLKIIGVEVDCDGQPANATNIMDLTQLESVHISFTSTASDLSLSASTQGSLKRKATD